MSSMGKYMMKKTFIKKIWGKKLLWKIYEEKNFYEKYMRKKTFIIVSYFVKEYVNIDFKERFISLQKVRRNLAGIRMNWKQAAAEQTADSFLIAAASHLRFCRTLQAHQTLYDAVSLPEGKGRRQEIPACSAAANTALRAWIVCWVNVLIHVPRAGGYKAIKRAKCVLQISE